MLNVKKLAGAIFQIDRILAVVLTAQTMILGYFHSQFPEYVSVISAVLAGISIFVAVSTKIATILSTASVQKVALQTGRVPVGEKAA